MTLKEKLRQNLTGHLSDEKTEVDVNIAEKIAEEFAIEFAEFCSKYHNKNRNIYGEMLHATSKYDDTYTTKELLEIYKKEQSNKCQYCGLENGNHKLSCPVIKITMIL
jgi:esterase/lipase